MIAPNHVVVSALKRGKEIFNKTLDMVVHAPRHPVLNAYKNDDATHNHAPWITTCRVGCVQCGDRNTDGKIESRYTGIEWRKNVHVRRKDGERRQCFGEEIQRVVE